MKPRILIACVALQILILAFMAGQREWIRSTGRTVYFRTAPMDPRDPLRGDYVRLNYDLSRVPRRLWRSPDATPMTNFATLTRDTRVYASLALQEDGVAQLQSLGTDRPGSGFYIRGRTENSSLDTIDVRYGLEALFLQQGKGIELEAGRNRDGIQVPLEVKAAVSPNGIAVLQDYRWCALGIGLNLEFTNTPSTNGQPGRKLVGATVQLLNTSSNEVAIAELPNGHGLALISDFTWGDNPNAWQWIPQEIQKLPSPPRLLVLKPGQIHSIHVSFDDPWWTVGKTGKPEEPRKLTDLQQEWNARFRLEYRPPDSAATKDIPNGNLVWHGHLATRAFSASGGVD